MIFPVHACTRFLARAAVVALVATGALVGPLPAEAQDPLGTPELEDRRQRYLRAAAHLAERPDPGYPWTGALHAWARCSDVGPDFLGPLRPGASADGMIMECFPYGAFHRTLKERIQGNEPLLGDPEERLLRLLHDVLDRDRLLSTGGPAGGGRAQGPFACGAG